MKMLNIPVQMICLFNEKGDMTPMRFRFTDSSSRLRTCKITKIISAAASELAGVNAFLYQCRAQLEDSIVTVRLRYTAKSREWVLTQLEK